MSAKENYSSDSVVCFLANVLFAMELYNNDDITFFSYILTFA